MSRSAENTPSWPASSDDSGAARRQPTRYLRSIAEHRVLVALIVGAALLTAFVYLAAAQKRYTAHAQVVVTPLPIDNTTFLGIGGLIRDSTTAQPVVTAAQLLNAPKVREQAHARLNVHGPVSWSVTPLGQSNVVDIAATASTPQAAQTAANLYAHTALDLRKAALQNELSFAIARLQGRLAVDGKGKGANNVLNAQITQQLAQLNSLVGSPDPTLALLNDAAEPSSYSWPRPKLSLLVALLCGLALGAIAAVLLDYFDPAVKDASDLRDPEGAHPLVRIPDVPERELQLYTTGAFVQSARYRDSFRHLRNVLSGSRRTPSTPALVVVCSNDRDEGRTATALGLAKAFADVGRSVVLVDGDTRRASATQMLIGTARGITLSDLLRSRNGIGSRLVSLGSNLAFVPAAIDPDGPDLIATDRLDAVLATLRDRFDSVVVDAPPFDAGDDAYAFAEAADAVLVCARLGHTNREAFRDSVRQLRELNAAPAGIVAVDRREHDDRPAAGKWWSSTERLRAKAAAGQEAVRARLAARREHRGSPGYD